MKPSWIRTYISMEFPLSAPILAATPGCRSWLVYWCCPNWRIISLKLGSLGRVRTASSNTWLGCVGKPGGFTDSLFILKWPELTLPNLITFNNITLPFFFYSSRDCIKIIQNIAVHDDTLTLRLVPMFVNMCKPGGSSSWVNINLESPENPGAPLLYFALQKLFWWWRHGWW